MYAPIGSFNDLHIRNFGQSLVSERPVSLHDRPPIFPAARRPKPVGIIVLGFAEAFQRGADCTERREEVGEAFFLLGRDNGKEKWSL